MADLSVPLLSTWRQGAMLAQKVQHAVPSVALLGHGVVRLSHEATPWSLVLGASEITVGALVIISFGRAIRAIRAKTGAADHTHHGSVDWLDIFIGAMLAVEVWAHWHETGRIQRPSALLVLLTIGLGLGHGWLAARQQRRRMLRVSDAGLSIGRGKFVPAFKASWNELRAVEIGPQTARVVKKDGSAKKINLADLKNADAVRAALEAARNRVPPVVAVPAVSG
ncbi:MAG TPA: hypothetical protein VFV98_10950 [Vicinamibacterales bacterium]|nr:hypothetical protein [Vicinamibacterales bacterium]